MDWNGAIERQREELLRIVAALVQQWDAAAKKWNAITDFMPADRDLVTRLAMEDSEAFAKENNITQRDCN